MSGATTEPGGVDAGTGAGADGPIHDWAAQLAESLGVEAPVDVPLLLDVARDVAHAVNRPAVPITMYLLGYAAAQRGGSASSVEEASAETGRLARAWAARADQAPTA